MIKIPVIKYFIATLQVRLYFYINVQIVYYEIISLSSYLKSMIEICGLIILVYVNSYFNQVRTILSFPFLSWVIMPNITSCVYTTTPAQDLTVLLTDLCFVYTTCRLQKLTRAPFYYKQSQYSHSGGAVTRSSSIYTNKSGVIILSF